MHALSVDSHFYLQCMTVSKLMTQSDKPLVKIESPQGSLVHDIGDVIAQFF